MDCAVDRIALSKLIGKTPMMKLALEGSRIWLKLEGNNIGGSVKDRAAWGMLRFAEIEGKLQEGATIVEPTSGNTGIGFAMLGASLGLKVILTMPESMSLERRSVLSAYGAEVVLTPAETGMKGAIEAAQKIVSEIPRAFMPDQFSNPGNPWAHQVTTGPEIVADIKGKEIAAFVAGVGTGGTITGVGRIVKAAFPNAQVIAVEPQKSAVLSGGSAGRHAIEGIGAGFVPKNLDLDIIDRVVQVPDEAAMEMARLLARKEGLFVGISTGANVWAALTLTREIDGNIVTISPDRGDKYLSTAAFKTS